jgi:2-methylcitrate dehydratase
MQATGLEPNADASYGIALAAARDPRLVGQNVPPACGQWHVRDFRQEETMDRTAPTECLDLPRQGRRRFLKQVAATGAAAAGAAGAMALPALAQEKLDPPAASRVATDQPLLAETLARYATSLKYEDLPPDVVRVAKRIIIDSIGCGIGAFSAETSQIANKLAAGVSAVRGASVLCIGVKTSPELAVFANGTMIRYLDFNDGYISLASGHPSDSIASVLSTAELAGRSGRDLITGTVLAYEVFCRVLDVFDSRPLGLDAATVIGLAATAAGSRMMGLTQQEIVHAIGIYVVGATTINQTRVGTLSNWKACASAESSRNAIFAIQLAQAGMTGPNEVFEGRDGFFNRVAHKPFRLPKLAGAGSNADAFGMMRCFAKRFTLGQYAQTVAQAAVEARAHFADPSEIAEVNIRVSHTAIHIMADSPDKWQPRTHETADHSMPYAAAVALIYGTVEEQHYEDPYLHDARLLDLVGRVRCIPSDEADRVEKEMNLCDLEVVLKSGQRRNVRVEYHRGHWKNPMTDAELEEKFRSLARKQLRPAQTDELLRQLWALDTVPQAGAILAGTRV